MTVSTRINKALLRSHMVRHGDTQQKLADAMGLSLSRLNAKINEKSGAAFTKAEIEFCISRYGLDSAESDLIFFADKVS